MKRKILNISIFLVSAILIIGCEARTESPKPSLLPTGGIIEASVAQFDSSGKKMLLVSGGVPFAPGQFFSEKNFAILDEKNIEIPIAVKVLARWPHDSSIRSLLVQFYLAEEKKDKQVFVQWGKPRTVKELELTEVNWALPEACVILPAKWLCDSKVIGEQAPFGNPNFSLYDLNIEKYYPEMRDAPLKGDISEDGYYDIGHVFYQLYVRTGDDDCLKAARRETLRYRNDIIQEGSDKGKHKQQEKTRYIYVEAMVDDYLLTGDVKSLEIAGYMADYLKSHYKPSDAFYQRNTTRFWTEREAAFPFLGVITYYELTGKKEYLEYASELMQNLYGTQLEWPDRGGFIHNLYSHDLEEGARKDEYGGSPFMTGLLLEAVIKYHQLTNSNIAKDSIFRALDWLIKEGLAPDGKSFVYLTCEEHRNEGHPDLNMLIVHAFGYGYKISGYTRKEYLEIGKKTFEEGVENAYLNNRKHFNQNYRSSGHFLAYISKREEIASPPLGARNDNEYTDD